MRIHFHDAIQRNIYSAGHDSIEPAGRRSGCRTSGGFGPETSKEILYNVFEEFMRSMIKVL